jgi:hypothetical protein
MRAAVRKEAKRQRRSMSWMMRDIFDQWSRRLAGEPQAGAGESEGEKANEDRV